MGGTQELREIERNINILKGGHVERGMTPRIKPRPTGRSIRWPLLDVKPSSERENSPLEVYRQIPGDLSSGLLWKGLTGSGWI